MLDQKFRMRACMWYDFKQGKSAAESHRALSEVFGEEALSESQCRRWFQRFKNGNESLEDEEHGSRPQFVDDQVLKSVIELDPRQATRELATHFGCSNSTIHEPGTIRLPSVLVDAALPGREKVHELGVQLL